MLPEGKISMCFYLFDHKNVFKIKFKETHIFGYVLKPQFITGVVVALEA